MYSSRDSGATVSRTYSLRPRRASMLKFCAVCWAFARPVVGNAPQAASARNAGVAVARTSFDFILRGQSRPRLRGQLPCRLERHGRDEVRLVDPTAGEALRVPGAEREAQEVAEHHVEPELASDAGLERRLRRIVEGAAPVHERGAADPVEEERKRRRAAIHVHDREAVLGVEERVVVAGLLDHRVAAKLDASLDERVL